MGLKNTIENNIIVVTVSVALAAGGVSAGIVGWFASQREALQQQVFQAKIDDIETRVSSVERRIGGEKYLDIRTLFSQSNPLQANPASVATKYFTSGNYSAAAGLGDLVYQHSSEGQVIAEMTGEPITDQPILSAATIFSADVWKGRSEKVDGSGGFKYLFPAVIVENITNDQIKKFSGEMFKFLSQDDVKKEVIDITSTTSENESNSDVDFLVDQAFRADMAAPFLMGTLGMTAQINASSKESGMSAVVKNIQKVGPLLYVQIIIEFENVTVGKHHYDRYFLIKEAFVISRKDSTTALVTLIPTDNPLAPANGPRKSMNG